MAMIKYDKIPPRQMPNPALAGDLSSVAEKRELACDIGLSVAVILYDPAKSRAGFFSLGGRIQDFADKAEQNLGTLLGKLSAMGSVLPTLECYLFGGNQKCLWQVSRLEKILKRHSLPVEVLDDVYGQVCRTFVFSPLKGTLSVSHLEEDANRWSPAASALSIEDGNRIFSQNAVTGKVANATRFFRERETFIGLREQVVPEYLQSKNSFPLLLWSAGCSSGEETYSYAMYLLRLQQRLKINFPFRIFGTDINRELLRDAQKGEYNIPREDLEEYGDYFRKFGTLSGQRITFGPEVREHVEFRPFDIRHHPRRRFRVIICANVFQYYNDQARIYFMNNFISASERPGYIFVNNFPAKLREPLGLEYFPKYSYSRVQ
ncbi:MAG: hypothetical protein JXA52_02040 [Planctomycetes bacterium]|nr:hypothetical protein [Planctomycetota bacterium]